MLPSFIITKSKETIDFLRNLGHFTQKFAFLIKKVQLVENPDSFISIKFDNFNDSLEN